MSNNTRAEIRTQTRTAVISALVTLAMVPASQVISYQINEYLSRPKLSIEYAQPVRIMRKVSLPIDDIHDLAQSPQYQSYMMKYGGMASVIAVLQRMGGSVSGSDLSKTIGDMRTFVHDLDSRDSVLAGLQKSLGEDPTKQQMKSISAKYLRTTLLGPMAGYYSGDSQLSKTELVSKIGDDRRNLKGIKKKSLHLLSLLKKAESNVPKKIYFRLSIENRGDADGLVRGRGRIQINHSDPALPIVRTRPPKRKSARSFQSIPVTVTNPPDVGDENGVSKLEKHAMTDYWYMIDESALSAEQRKLVQHLGQSDWLLGGAKLYLLDQNRHPLTFIFARGKRL